MEKSRAIELLKLAVPIKALTQQEYFDFVEAVNMAIDALKEQLSKEDATSDTISRTEVVEHLRRVLEATVPNTDYDEGFVDGIEFGISTVSTMPTIQPQSTTGQLNDGARSTAQSTDLIDRQAAIDAVDKYDFNIPEYMEGFVTKLRDAMKEDLREDIAGLPSVQPEYRLDEWCMDCKEYDQEKHCCPRFNRVIREAAEEVRQNAQPEPSIPLSWIENEIKWLKSLDSTFSEITALQISAMVNKWRDEKK